MKKYKTVYHLDADEMNAIAHDTWMSFLAMAPNAHTIDIVVRADGKEHRFQADFLKSTTRTLMLRSQESFPLQ